MSNSELHIKNMVCPRCIKVVKDEFKNLGIEIKEIELGRVEMVNELSEEQITKVREVLEENGFELIGDKKGQLIDAIKSLIIEKIHHSDDITDKMLASDVIASQLGHDYSYLSHLFSSVEGTTIEKYIINQKIEKVKELLVYDELTLNEISYQLGYSSVQHLSNQFKKVTGLTPSYFKKMKHHNRKPLDEV